MTIDSSLTNEKYCLIFNNDHRVTFMAKSRFYYLPNEKDTKIC